MCLDLYFFPLPLLLVLVVGFLFFFFFFFFFLLNDLFQKGDVWPDPRSPVLQGLQLPWPVPVLLEWLQIRDMFLGDNVCDQDIVGALKLAKTCRHPDAVFLAEIFADSVVVTAEEAGKVLSRHLDDPRACCFAWAFNKDESALKRAVDAGYAYAQTCVRGRDFDLAQKAAAQFERDGFWSAGQCAFF